MSKLVLELLIAQSTLVVLLPSEIRWFSQKMIMHENTFVVSNSSETLAKNFITSAVHSSK